ncbi:cysteine proteinase [Agrocybe pediades]|nr:cysteine proteinase [Agrocybe pediades]
MSSCPHFSATLSDAGLASEITTKYNAVVAWYAHRSQTSPRPAKRRKISVPTCGTCALSLSRPFACLHCTYTGCWHGGHVGQHLRDSDHQFCVDAHSGSVFCSECDDFIYDARIDTMRLSAVVTAEQKHAKWQKSKTTREIYKPWTPNEKEMEALAQTQPIPCQGRRGLLNLGQTCYMNVVLQCFVHNPLLRNYFLSDKHNTKQCKLENCACCEMDKLFTEIYSDDPAPFGPISFLATTWKASAELSGYKQQDAHEFFMANLNHIHSTSRGSTNIDCNCIIHSTFSGSLQSEVTCDRCGNTTPTNDPVLDISLELKAKVGDPTSGDTLAACLRRFTQPERLGREYSCAKCVKPSPEATKRFSFQKLPPVLAFQFKRFEHKTNDKSSARKIDTPIRFPATLNMAPYTTQVLKEGGKEILSYSGREGMCEYDLFAVINHDGQIDNGHYTNYARFNYEWYRFDDDKVIPSSLAACLNSNAYMCFYVKRHLDYKPNQIPSYVLAMETEAQREKELEKEKEAARMKELEDDLLSTL